MSCKSGCVCVQFVWLLVFSCNSNVNGNVYGVGLVRRLVKIFVDEDGALSCASNNCGGLNVPQ